MSRRAESALLSAVVLAFALAVAGPPAAAERLAWLTAKPTWKAVHVPQPPDRMDAFDYVSAVLAGDRPAATTDLLLTRLERHLEQASEVYRGAEGYAREWGFQGPNVQIVEAGGHATYLAIAQPGLDHAGFQTACHVHPGEPAARRRDVLGGGAPIFAPAAALDDNSGRGGSLGWRTGFTPAHELFHAIQEGYPFSPGRNEQGTCPHKWINEGTANAAAFGVLEARGVLDFERHGPRARYFMGLRPYYIPLHGTLPGKGNEVQAQYGSSSFWRFLYERSRPRQWTYLETLFQVPIREGGARKDSLLWVEEGLERLEWPPLHVVYPAFLADYALWGRERFGNRGYASDWLGESFGGCYELTLEPSAPSRTVDLNMRARPNRSTDTSVGHDLLPMSGRCLRVRTAGFGRAVEIDVLAEAGARRLVDQLWLGADGELIKGGYRKGNGEAGTTVGAMEGFVAKRWSLGPQDTDPESGNLLVLARARPDVGEPSGGGELRVTVTAGVWEAEVPPAVPRDDARPTQGRPETGRPPIPGPPTAAGPSGGAAQVSIDDLHRTDLAMEIDRKQRPCGRIAGLPDDTRLCGPRLVVKLSSTAGPTGMTPGRIPDYGEVMAVIREQARAARADRDEAPTVKLVMPAIDYGETGSYEAIIRVDYPDPGAETLASLRRQVLAVDEKPREEVTGRVTVERYTPAALVGTFSGTLYGIVRKDGELTQVTEPVRGRFSVATPVADDPRTRPFKTDAGRRLAAYMGLGATEYLRPVRATVEREFMERAGAPAGGGGGGGGGAGAVAPAGNEASGKRECVYDGVALVGGVPMSPAKCAEMRERYKAFPEEKWQRLKRMYGGGGPAR